jgi:copper transport protein
MNPVRQHHRQWKGAAAWLLLAFVFLWLLAIGPRVVKAHAILLRSTPEANAELAQPPPTIEMWFSEPLEAGFSTARLLDSQGQEVPTGAVSLDPSDPTHMTLPLGQLGPGIYTVAWQTLSQADGHEWYGSFPLTVLNPDGSRPTPTSVDAGGGERGELPSPGEVIARWLVLLGGLLLFGVPLFQLVVAPTSQKLPSGNSASLVLHSRDLALRAVWIAVLAIVLGSWLQVALQALRLGGVDQLPSLLLGTRTGTLALARQALAFAGLLVVLGLPQPWPLRGREWPCFLLTGGCGAIVIVLLLFATPQGDRVFVLATVIVAGLGIALATLARRDDTVAVERRTWQALLILAGVLLINLSMGSHAAAVPGSVWAILGDAIHLMAAAAWISGLTMLPILIWQVRRSTVPADRSQLLPLIQRFSYLASFAVFALILTGLFSSLVELSSLSDLWDTPYGLVLLTKLFLITFALEVAFFNNRLVHRHSRQLQQAAGLQRFNRQVALEAAFSLGVMLSVAILVQTPTPRSFTQATNATQTSPPYNAIARADDLYIHVQATPNQVGNNRFWTHLYHPDGSPIGEVQLVRLLFDYREQQLGQARADLEPLGQDTFAAEGAYINQAGLWDLSIYVRRRGLDDTLAEVSVEVPPPTGRVAGISPWENPIPVLPEGMVIAVVLVALGLIPWLWHQPLREIFDLKSARKPKAQAWPLSAIALSGGIIVLVGMIIALASIPALLARLNPGGQPVPASPSSIAAGAELYQKQCTACHGVEGLGNGPQAANLEPPPANMRIHVPLHDDRELYGFISQGFPGTAMPAYADGLTHEEIWNLVNYLRTKFGQRG